MRKTIFCDFDGTISLIDVTDYVLEKFADPKWQEIEAQWKANLIGSRECLQQQIDLLHVNIDTLCATLDQVEIDPYFSDFVAASNKAGYELVIISDGLDFSIQRILQRYQLAHLPIMANHLEILADDRYRIQFPYASAVCQTSAGHCKCQTLAKQQVAFSVMIGDGMSDFCVAGKADMVFSKGKLSEYCAKNHIAHHKIESFEEASIMIALNSNKF